MQGELLIVSKIGSTINGNAFDVSGVHDEVRSWVECERRELHVGVSMTKVACKSLKFSSLDVKGYSYV